MPAVRPMLRAVGHGVPTAHGPKWADSCGSQWEQRVLLRPPVDEQLGRNALREVRESDHPMTAPDPLALAEEAEEWVSGFTSPAARELTAVVMVRSLAAALRAAHEENRRLREATGGLVPPRWASLVEVSDEIAAELLAAPSRPVTVRLERRDDGRLEVLFQQHECTPTPDPLALAAALRAAHEENKRLVTQAAELGKWRDAVLNAAVVDWTYRKEHETDPVRAVNDLVCYALDVEREALRKENQRLREALQELVDAMHRYEADAEGEQPASHRNIMRRAHAALAGGKGGGGRMNRAFDPPLSSGHGCAPMCAACRAELQNRMNPTGDPLGFNVERWLEGERQAACGRHTSAQQVCARLRAWPGSGGRRRGARAPASSCEGPTFTPVSGTRCSSSPMPT